LRRGRKQVALEADQRKIAAEKEVQDLKRELGCKRPQADASTIDANVEMPSEVGDLDLADHCGHAKQWWNQSQVELSSLEEVPPSRTGKDWTGMCTIQDWDPQARVLNYCFK